MASESTVPADPAESPLGLSQESASQVIEDIRNFMSDLDFATQQDNFGAAPLSVNMMRRLTILRKRLATSQDKMRQRLSSNNLNSLRRKMITGNPHKRVRDFVKEEPVVKTIDKFSFVAGVSTMLALEYFLLQETRYLPYFYVALMFPLLMARWFLYRKAGWQYFLADFCYFLNWLTMLCILLPSVFGATARRISFVMGHGPLAIAIVAWRNSMVFHSLDKTTSVYLHVLPALVSFSWRWDELTECHANPELEMCQLSLMDWLVYPLAFYAAWQVFYLWYTEVLNADHLRTDQALETSLRWLARSPGGMAAVAKTFCRAVGIMKPDENFDSESMKTKLIFVACQFIFTIFTILPCKLYFDYYLVNVGFLLFIYIACLYNGASYYIHVFSKRYVEQFRREIETAAVAQEAKIEAIAELAEEQASKDTQEQRAPEQDVQALNESTEDPFKLN